MKNAEIILAFTIGVIGIFCLYCHTAEQPKPLTAALAADLALILCAIEMIMRLA